MNARLETLEKVRRKINDAYHTRLTAGPKDYPPLAIMGFDDRARYHAFIIKLIDEEIDYEKGGERDEKRD